MYNMRYLFFLILFGFTFSSAYGQVEISAGVGYVVPQGELKWIYNAAPSYSLSFARIKNQSSVGIRLGYFQFKPKQDVFYYLYGEEDYGTIKYSNYKAIQLVIPFRWDFDLGDKLELALGIEGGYTYVHYTFDDANPDSETNAENIEGKGMVAPVIGFNWKITESIGLLVNGQYNMIVSLGSIDSTSGNYNPNVGTFNTFISTNIGAFVRF